jgi:hypothetical protein
MIGGNDLDIPALAGDAEIQRCLFGADYASRPAIVTIRPRLVVQHPKADRRRLRPRWKRRHRSSRGRGAKQGAAGQTHEGVP